jgi:hypothetical protein
MPSPDAPLRFRPECPSIGMPHARPGDNGAAGATFAPEKYQQIELTGAWAMDLDMDIGQSPTGDTTSDHTDRDVPP